MPSRSARLLSTEYLNPRYLDLDLWPSLDALEAMLDGQMAAVAAVRPALPVMAQAAEAAAERLGASGRLIYVGAGTSGRIGVQDGVELTPTFNWPTERVAYAMAGGDVALLRSVENAEDDRAAAAADMAALKLCRHDVVIGVAASGTTPFTVAALEAARAAGALTIGVANNPGAPLLGAADFGVLCDTGAEVVAGSTRMKAGTAQKIVLNLFSTLLMIRLGRVYRGMMVDMRTSNAKLRQRGERMVERIAGCDADKAKAAFAAAKGNVKLALLVAHEVELGRAASVLSRNNDNIRAALAEVGWGGDPVDDGC